MSEETSSLDRLLSAGAVGGAEGGDGEDTVTAQAHHCQPLEVIGGWSSTSLRSFIFSSFSLLRAVDCSPDGCAGFLSWQRSQPTYSLRDGLLVCCQTIVGYANV